MTETGNGLWVFSLEVSSAMIPVAHLRPGVTEIQGRENPESPLMVATMV